MASWHAFANRDDVPPRGYALLRPTALGTTVALRTPPAMKASSARVVVIALVAMPFAVAASYLVRARFQHAGAEASVLLPVAPVEPQEPTADWCAQGFASVPGGCLAVPEGATTPPLLVYLHGRYARDVVSDEVDRQRRLGALGTKRGYAVLAVRSRLGVCASPELAEWFCWPTSEAAADPDAIRRWSRVVDEVQLRVGATRRYLLGFSSGGYFAGMVATQGWAPFDAVVVAHGGPVEPMRPLGATPPILLLSADDDVAQVDMMRLDDDLRRAAWPHDAYARGGVHGLADADIDAALSFFARSSEAMPLRPPLPLHRAVFHVHDAGPEAGAPDDDAATPEAPAATPPRADPLPDDAVVTPDVADAL
jgi:predicted esterase